MRSCEMRRNNKCDYCCVDVAALRKFPDDQRMPGVDQHIRRIHLQSDQQLYQQEYSRQIEQEHRDLHSCDGRPYLAGSEKDHLRHWRINGRSVISAVDPGIDRIILKKRKMLVARYIAVRVYPRRLNFAVPNIAEDVARQLRWERRNQNDSENHC